MKTLLLILAIAGYVGLLSGADAHAIKSAMHHGPKEEVFVKHRRSRIVGGENAVVAQFPFAVAIIVDGRFLCTGSLLSQQWIVTACHCAGNVSKYRVQLGMTNLNANEEGGVSSVLRKSIENPNYDYDTDSNDIALLMMATSVTYTSTIQPVSLPTRSMQSNNFVGSKVRTAGWGFSDATPNDVSPVLNYVDLEVITKEECENRLGAIDASIICARGNGGKKGPCGGDSGGPLIINYNTSSPVLVGLTSFGSGRGCWAGEPAGFARVTYQLDWIHSTTGIAIQS